MSPIKPKEPFLLQDRVLFGALCFGSSGYIIIGSWAGVALMVAAFILAVVWAFRTASSHPNKTLRLMASLMLITLGAYLTVYISITQGVIS
jgi:hypothetical protein